MISEKSIDELREKIDIVELIKKSVELKKKGTTWTGCCPFHGEKTPSFSVSEVKQIFKCFGCGVGGDVIKFKMKIDNLEFIPALRKLASDYNFEFEEFEETTEQKEAAVKKVDLFKINAAAARHYQDRLFDQFATHWSVEMILEGRQYHPGTILDFGLGYATEARRELCDIVTAKDLYYQAEEVGLVKMGENGSTYDVFRDRVIFPIHNEQGFVVGFGGRKSTKDEKKDNPKYINSKESILYKKDRVLYGLYQAKKHIKDAGFVIIVEGYTDVISMHQAGVPNTVATCGTALTPHHAKLIKRYTKKVILLADGDKPGQDANLKAVDILIAEDLNVFICPLPEEDDPDTFARKHFLSAETI